MKGESISKSTFVNELVSSSNEQKRQLPRRGASHGLGSGPTQSFARHLRFGLILGLLQLLLVEHMINVMIASACEARMHDIFLQKEGHSHVVTQEHPRPSRRGRVHDACASAHPSSQNTTHAVGAQAIEKPGAKSDR